MDVIEVLLFEASGQAFNNNDLSKHAYDLVKGSFGSTAMLKSILRKYSHPALALIETTSTVFVQTSTEVVYPNETKTMMLTTSL